MDLESLWLDELWTLYTSLPNSFASAWEMISFVKNIPGDLPLYMTFMRERAINYVNRTYTTGDAIILIPDYQPTRTALDYYSNEKEFKIISQTDLKKIKCPKRIFCISRFGSKENIPVCDYSVSEPLNQQNAPKVFEYNIQ
ncbi:MAG: hypothetical protein KKD39_05300 [Candidatus Altiarchaeota archaeon]|nr:hypothetical protein [Candidatus Altiarchaeota archaeon]